MKVSIKENVFKMLKVQEKFARVDVQNSGSIYEDKKSDSNILLLKGSSFLSESLCYSYTSAWLLQQIYGCILPLKSFKQKKK